MSIEPRVSVVMSAFNEACRIGVAIDGLLKQTFRDFVIIVVDDGSEDGTPEVLDRYSRLDSRIRVIQQANFGLTMALINGCNAAKSEYIARHDADDWSDQNRLAEQVAMLDANQDLGLVSCATQYVGPLNEPLELIVRIGDPPEATGKLLDEYQGPPAHGSVMFRRSLYEQVGGYRSEFYFGQDSDLWMRMCERSQIGYDAKLLYFARRDPNSVSGRMGTRQQEFGRWGQACRAARREGLSEESILALARESANELRTCKTKRTSSWGLATMACLIGTTLLKRGDPSARKYFWQAVRSHPLYWRAWIRLLRMRAKQ